MNTELSLIIFYLICLEKENSLIENNNARQPFQFKFKLFRIPIMLLANIKLAILNFSYHSIGVPNISTISNGLSIFHDNSPLLLL